MTFAFSVHIIDCLVPQVMLGSWRSTAGGTGGCVSRGLVMYWKGYRLHGLNVSGIHNFIIKHLRSGTH